MKKYRLYSIIFLIILYISLSLIIDKPLILPKISEITIELLSILESKNFFNIIFLTIIRTIVGVLISFVLAIILASISFKYKKFKEFFFPIYTLLKTIPNITYIIIALLWIGRDGSVILVASTVIFPIFYNSILNAFENIDISLLEYTSLFKSQYLNKLYKVYLPLIKKQIVVSIGNCLSLSFKVSIMAEMLSQIKNGIGRELYFAKMNLEMPRIFAWTIIIILISYIFDSIIQFLLKKTS